MAINKSFKAEEKEGVKELTLCTANYCSLLVPHMIPEYCLESFMSTKNE